MLENPFARSLARGSGMAFIGVGAPALQQICVASCAAEASARRNSAVCVASSSSSAPHPRAFQTWWRGSAVAFWTTKSQRARQHCFTSFGCRAAYVSGSGALTPDLKEALDNFVSSNKVVLFMKGNRNFPQCGFSNTCVQILNQFNVPYETVNILEDESLRQGVKEYSSWPTYPQLYIDGEFFGGCDIALDAYHSGELKEAIDKALLS